MWTARKPYCSAPKCVAPRDCSPMVTLLFVTSYCASGLAPWPQLAVWIRREIVFKNGVPRLLNLKGPPTAKVLLNLFCPPIVSRVNTLCGGKDSPGWPHFGQTGYFPCIRPHRAYIITCVPANSPVNCWFFSPPLCGNPQSGFGLYNSFCGTPPPVVGSHFLAPCIRVLVLFLEVFRGSPSFPAQCPGVLPLGEIRLKAPNVRWVAPFEATKCLKTGRIFSGRNPPKGPPGNSFSRRCCPPRYSATGRNTLQRVTP